MRIHCFAEPAEWEKERCTLPDRAAHHLSTVLRVRPGTRVTVFDGGGRAAKAEVIESSGSSVVLRVGERWTVPPPATRITLYLALPKGAALELVLQKAVELGTARVVPFEARRSVARLKPEQRRRKTGRWRTIVRNAAEQCGACRLTDVAEPAGFESALESARGEDRLLIGALEEERRPLREVLRESPAPESVGLMIGPEGDFTGEEVRAAIEAGAVPVCFGDRILRTETAALFGLSVLAYEFLHG
ncbi:RsmE family RNA methyltransferase [Kiritimatiella glycovorans]|uniref:Ribosomal RNA small subunit methyltransferase E n=1 Tax=Kiritimatiella glycovorans TaxID=1307763 RepID=A0A0G3EJ00_9BACT|nr:RsmE family RNA methyltransferase [Kiritimatiella glycovorans]AKJ65402.1 Ribosomal RNA small subunit methyltransferase E [Kiritimatiella glycovorans]